MQKNLFLLIGAPGSGKTTDASIIAKEQGFAHYSTGDLLRDEAKSGSKLGQEIQSRIDAGLLVPLEIVIETIYEAIKNSPKSTVIIDGYPRSVEQMRALDERLNQSKGIKLAQVFEVDVDKETAMDRCLGRARGADDNAEVFHNRWDVFIKPLEAIRSFYKEKNLYSQIDAKRDIAAITQDLTKAILNILKD